MTLTGIARIEGGDGNDGIQTGAGNDILCGKGGSDSLTAGAGDDFLDGGAVGDTLRGEAGADVLIGGAGADNLTGGTEADVFRYLSLADSPSAGRDSITNFSRAQGDRIDLAAIDANATAAGDQAFAFVGTAAFTGGGTASVRAYVSGCYT